MKSLLISLENKLLKKKDDLKIISKSKGFLTKYFLICVVVFGLIQLIIFDILYFNGLSLITIPFLVITAPGLSTVKFGMPKSYRKPLIYFFIVILLTILVLIPRGFTVDGLRRYIFNTKMSSGDMRVDLPEFPYLPYFFEQFLGLTASLFGWFGVNLVFVFAVFLSVHTSLKLYRSYFSEKKKLYIYFSLLILVSSPVFLDFATHEYKMDLFLIPIMNCCLLLCINFYKNKEFQLIRVFYLGILVSLGILTKITFIAFVLPLFIIFFHSLFKSNITNIKKLKYSLVLCLLASLPVLIWLIVFGAGTSPFRYYMGMQKQRITLNRNLETFNECFSEFRNRDYTQFFKPGQPPLLVIYPYKFSVNHNSPGILIFYSSLLLLPFGFFIKKRLNFPYNFIFMSYGLLSILMIIKFKSIHWYLYPIYPILSMLFPLALDIGTVKGNLKKVFIYFQIVSSVISISMFFCLSLMKIYKNPFHSDYAGEIYEFNKYLEGIGDDGNIFLQHRGPSTTYVTFAKDIDKVIVYSFFYFAGMDNPVDTLADFKNNNIRYIVTSSNNFNTYYGPCTQKETSNLEYFIEKNTRLVFENDAGKVFMIIY